MEPIGFSEKSVNIYIFMQRKTKVVQWSDFHLGWTLKSCIMPRTTKDTIDSGKLWTGVITVWVPVFSKRFAGKNLQIYTGCSRRNVPDFGRMFVMLKYTDVTLNTCIHSWSVTEILAIEMCGVPAVPCTVAVSPCFLPYTVHVRPYTKMRSLLSYISTLILLTIHVPCEVLGTLRTTTTFVWAFISLI
jgi:hypothetical protein